ncbi:hypothetical protein [Agrococcus sp. BE272]|uniref:hypothetical protein n=1 Tax=Agrococcus sp. BE272 TaxID=2817727 RepID=UPI0028659D43|nr:hypothetical protein [Agrococcus sp. BE272]MDR7233024.1 hypothetical protein [Agrococcus sp. BE272]
MHRTLVWLAALVLALPPLVIAASWAVLAPELPSRIATHWSDAGVADGVSETTPMGIGLLAATGAMLVAALVLAALRIDDGARAVVLSIMAGVSAMLAAAWVISAVTTIEAGSAEQAVLGPWLALLVGSVLLLVVPWLIHPRGEMRVRDTDPPLPLEPTDAERWSADAQSPALALLGIALLVGGVLAALLLPLGDGPVARVLLALVLLLAAAVVIGIARIRVVVDADGLRVRSALLGFPLRRIPTARIRVAEARLVEPLHWGGWGYRGLPGHVAVVLRRGPGIVVTTREGARFAVTVDGAQVGAAVLAGVVARHRAEERETDDGRWAQPEP